ncbi:hypothetical protein KM043_004035 [Ampulex compressa]|nr:hypothetical protein KM043_004035 [Ampulex compressa]
MRKIPTKETTLAGRLASRTADRRPKRSEERAAAAATFVAFDRGEANRIEVESRKSETMLSLPPKASPDLCRREGFSKILNAAILKRKCSERCSPERSRTDQRPKRRVSHRTIRLPRANIRRKGPAIRERYEGYRSAARVREGSPAIPAPRTARIPPERASSGKDAETLGGYPAAYFVPTRLRASGHGSRKTRGEALEERPGRAFSEREEESRFDTTSSNRRPLLSIAAEHRTNVSAASAARLEILLTRWPLFAPAIFRAQGRVGDPPVSLAEASVEGAAAMERPPSARSATPRRSAVWPQNYE